MPAITRVPILLSAVLFALTGLSVYSQSEQGITFECVVSKERLGVNERLKVDFKMNRDGDNFEPPPFRDFEVVMGPSQVVNSSFVNGKRSFSKTYSYFLNPRRVGPARIGQATIEIGGKVYKTSPRSIEVTAAVENPNAPKSASDIADESVYLIAEVSRSSPYLNEGVSIVYKLYVSPEVGVADYKFLNTQRYDDFWSQEIDINQLSVQEETFKGRTFKGVVLKKMVLYPQKSGTLDIEPLTLELVVNVPSGRTDYFGRPLYQQAKKRVSAGKRSLKVRPLPEEGRPDDFTGAVGSFDFEVTTSKKQLNASESLQARVKVSGKGNLKLFQLPEIELPPALEVYDPEVGERIRTNLSGMEGSVTESYTVVPSFHGKYPVPSLRFSYFDPREEKYRTLESEPITLEVLEGPQPTDAGRSGYVGPAYSAPEGRQFQFIKLKTDLVPVERTRFFDTRAYYLWLLAPLALVPIGLIGRRVARDRVSDPEAARSQKAARLARRYLASARKELGNKEAFYVALERGLLLYIKSRLHIDNTSSDKETIRRLLSDKGVAPEAVEGFVQLLKNCEAARYSPFTQVQMEGDYQNAVDVVARIDKSIKP